MIFVTNVSGWVTYVGIFPILGGHSVSVKLMTWSRLLWCLVWRPGTSQLRHFDCVIFIPLGVVEVVLGCVKKYAWLIGLDGPGWHIQRRRTALILVSVETLSFVNSSLAILPDLIQFFFFGSDGLSVASRGCSIKCASSVGSPNITIRYLSLMSYHSCLLSLRGITPSAFSCRISHLVVHILWIGSIIWELSIPVHDVPLLWEQPCCLNSHNPFRSNESLPYNVCCHPISPCAWKDSPVLYPSRSSIVNVSVVGVSPMVRQW